MNEWGMVRTLGGPAQAEVLAVGRRGRGEGRPFSRALGLGPGRQMLSIAPQAPSGASSCILRIKGVSLCSGCAQVLLRSHSAIPKNLSDQPGGVVNPYSAPG